MATSSLGNISQAKSISAPRSEGGVDPPLSVRTRPKASIYARPWMLRHLHSSWDFKNRTPQHGYIFRSTLQGENVSSS